MSATCWFILLHTLCFCRVLAGESFYRQLPNYERARSHRFEELEWRRPVRANAGAIETGAGSGSGSGIGEPGSRELKSTSVLGASTMGTSGVLSSATASPTPSFLLSPSTPSSLLSPSSSLYRSHLSSSTLSTPLPSLSLPQSLPKTTTAAAPSPPSSIPSLPFLTPGPTVSTSPLPGTDNQIDLMTLFWIIVGGGGGIVLLLLFGIAMVICTWCYICAKKRRNTFVYTLDGVSS